MKYAYYPGCSLERNAAAYDVSARAVAERAGHQARRSSTTGTAAAPPSTSRQPDRGLRLIARNLALATKNAGLDQLVAPCPPAT